AVLRDGSSLDQFHDEVRATLRRGAGVEEPGDVGVIHQRQGLPLGLEPGDDLPAVQPWLDDLQGHPALDRLLLLGREASAHAALTDVWEKLVRADERARSLGEPR